DVLNREAELASGVGLEEERDERRDHRIDDGGHDRRESSADDDRDSQVDDVALGDEFPESLEHDSPWGGVRPQLEAGAFAGAGLGPVEVSALDDGGSFFTPPAFPRESVR